VVIVEKLVEKAKAKEENATEQIKHLRVVAVNLVGARLTLAKVSAGI
jgi:hypothetical protein